MSNPKIHISTIFKWCTDIEAMRRFYTDLLGLEETFFQHEGSQGWLTYKSQDVQIVFIQTETPLPVATEWAKQPGYAEGSLETSSWVMTVSYAEFSKIVERVQTTVYPSLTPQTPPHPNPTIGNSTSKTLWASPLNCTVSMKQKVKNKATLYE